MAKYGVTNIVGGGGIGSDELSVTKEYVLNGKTYVGSDTSDEIGTGTMVNNGATGNQSLNAGGSFSVKKGYHAQDFTVNANNLASQTPSNATTAHILSGQTAWVNGTKINGAIPWQNAEIAGTDRAWSQGMSNWAGTINLKVRNGHYLNGVNWIQQDIPNLRPENIKKGVNIGGLIGTFEGYVPQPTDLYLRGNNIAGWVGTITAYIKFDSGQITSSANSTQHYIYTGNTINLTGYNRINVEGYTQNNVRQIIYVNTANGAYIQDTGVASTDAFIGPGNFTTSLDISSLNANRYIHTNLYGGSIYRIWLS